MRSYSARSPVLWRWTDASSARHPPSSIGWPHGRDSSPERRSARVAAKAIDPLTRLVGFSPARTAAAFLPRDGHEVIPTTEFLAAEVPAVNGVFTARSLARLYAALGSDDGLDGVRLWSNKTRRIATQPQVRRRDQIVPIRLSWRLGYHQPFPTKHTSPSSFGFFGAYGSGGYADPDRRVAVGFVVHQAKRAPPQQARATPQRNHRAYERWQSPSLKYEDSHRRIDVGVCRPKCLESDAEMRMDMPPEACVVMFVFAPHSTRASRLRTRRFRCRERREVGARRATRTAARRPARRAPRLVSGCCGSRSARAACSARSARLPPVGLVAVLP